MNFRSCENRSVGTRAHISRASGRLRSAALAVATLLGSVALGGMLSAPASAAVQPAWPNSSTPVQCAAPAGALCPNPPVQPGGLNHFLCYDVTTSQFGVPPAVRLTDQFGVHDPVPLTATSPQMLCNPVQKQLLTNGPGGPAGTVYPAAVDPRGHLYCFDDSTPGYPLPTDPTLVDPAGYDVQNQFGTFHVTIQHPTQLCLPSWKFDPNDPGILPGSVLPTSWTDPSALELNHFQCYAVGVQATPQLQVALTDQFSNYPDVHVGNVAELCAPVVKQVYPATGGQPGPGSDINSDQLTGAHLLCFSIDTTPPAIGLRNLLVGNQFSQPAAGAPPTPIPVLLNGQPPVQVCLPSFKVPTTSTGTPEVPFALLLPILGFAVAGGVIFVSRRRHVGPVVS